MKVVRPAITDVNGRILTDLQGQHAIVAGERVYPPWGNQVATACNTVCYTETKQFRRNAACAGNPSDACC